MRLAGMILAVGVSAATAHAAVITFTDVTNSAFTSPPALAGNNCTIGDIDADGDLDLWVFNVGSTDDKLYRNDGAGHFEDITASAGVAGRSGAGGEFEGTLADYDNDGLPDSCVATSGFGTNNSPAFLYHNLGECHFEDMAESLGVTTTLDEDRMTWGDVNADGWLDIYLASFPRVAVSNRPYLYLSQHGSGFQDAWTASGLTYTGGGAGHLFFDWEDDGDQDLYIASYFDYDWANTRDRLYRNVGGGQFVEASNAVSPEAVPTTGVQLADFDGDGRLDLFVLNEQTPNYVWRDNGDGTFTDIAAVLNLAMIPNHSIEEKKAAAAVADFDNDMDPDVFVANYAMLVGGEPRDYLMMNEGGVFVNRALSVGITERVNDFACAAGDLNGDGFLDIYVVNDNGGGTRDTLWQNNGNSNHWIEIDPRGIASNRDAFGLRAWVTADGVSQVQELYCHSAHPSRLHFGLGPNTVVTKLTLRWPSGLYESYADVAADQVFRPIEGAVVPFGPVGVTMQ